LISQRTKEALQRKKAEGVKLGRPKGRLNSKHKLTGCECKIRTMLSEGYPKNLISKQLNVSPSTLYLFMKEKKITF
jgi:DNA invertase Pin-like site-specific DNA recombinase